jgi:hypothetical protein
MEASPSNPTNEQKGGELNRVRRLSLFTPTLIAAGS